MLILGIETSCDETAMAVLSAKSSKEHPGGENVKVLSNIVSSQVKIHAKYGGVFPALAAREHAKNIDKVLRLALKEAGLYKGSPTSLKLRRALREIDLIAVTNGPGLAVALITGITFAKTLAWKYKKPIVGVNHLEGHIYSNWLPPIDKTFTLRSFSEVGPALNLIVSGGHTELVLMKEHGKYMIIGETLDDAAGEAFDKIARLLELGYPGGPLISQEAEKLSKSEIYPLENSRARSRGSRVGRISDWQQIILPRPMINSKDFNFSFSGLKTAVLYLIRNLRSAPRFDLDKIRPAIAHEAQQAIVDVLIAKTIKATEKYKPKSILLSGGVSANSQLRTVLRQTAEKLGINYSQPELKYTGDNAAMIALAGYFRSKKTKNAKLSWRNIKLDASLRLGKKN